MNNNHDADNCICEIVKNIDKAQSIAESTCIKHKLNIGHILEIDTQLNTIPIMLICKNPCDYFVSTGIFKSDNCTFKCFRTSIFRVSTIKEEDSKQCFAELELLQPQCENGSTPAFCQEHDISNIFPSKTVKEFIRTGIFITVDLSCFCGIECLPAVKAQHGKPKESSPSVIDPKIIQEEICGNFGPGKQIVWESEPGIYLEGTCQIFNSAQSTEPIKGFVSANKLIPFPPVLPGSTISRSVSSPKSFIIEALEGTNGQYCIILTKIVSFNQHNID